MSDSLDLLSGHCKPSDEIAAPLTTAQIDALLKKLDGWNLRDGVITKTYTFRNYHQTMAFVNATAWISHREDHHPDLIVGYDKCRVAYHTHTVKGISENDFICAAKLDALFDR